MLIKITAKRQATFPAKVLEAMGVKPGDQLELSESPNGFIRLARKTPPFRAGMDSADGRAVLFNGGSAAARCTAE